MATRLEHTWGVTPPRRRSEPSPQLSFVDVRGGRGGRRKGAGRPEGARPNVRHFTRPAHDHAVPSLVTLRRANGLPSLRHERIRRLFEKAIRDTCAQRSREGFRIVEYSIQSDHVHLIIEADDNLRLARGMQSFAVRVAMRINRTILERRSGRVWGDRYHRRDLPSPAEVRSALVYVLRNHVKHGHSAVAALDPCSSGPWFEGWHHHPPVPPDPRPVEKPWTWLLEKGWQRASIGFIHIDEVPRAARERRTPRR